jgi:hypothetical protein
VLYVPASGIPRRRRLEQWQGTYRVDSASAPCNTQIAAFKAAELTNMATYCCHGSIHVDANSVGSTAFKMILMNGLGVRVDERFGLYSECADVRWEF